MPVRLKAAPYSARTRSANYRPRDENKMTSFCSRSPGLAVLAAGSRGVWSSLEAELHPLCPGAVDMCVWRRSGPHSSCLCVIATLSGAALSLSSDWLCDAICLGYTQQWLAPPLGVRAHSTRKVAMSTAVVRGLSSIMVFSQPIGYQAGSFAFAPLAVYGHKRSRWLSTTDYQGSGARPLGWKPVTDSLSSFVVHKGDGCMCRR